MASVATAERAHRQRRDERARRTGRMNVVSKLVNVGLRFITIPLSLQLLGKERYGLWLTVGSLLTWLSVYDLGLSSGLLNTVGEALGQDDRSAIRRNISTALAGFTAMALLMAALVVAGSRWSGVPRLIGIAPGSALAADAGLLVLFCGLLFAASFACNSVNHFVNALQEGYLVAYAQVGGAVLTCIALFVLSLRGARLLEFAAAMSGPPLLMTAALAGYVFLVRHRAYRPSLSLCSVATLRHISGYGTPVFLAQLADMAILYTTMLLMANRLGPAAVPAYTVPATAFVIATTLCYSLTVPYQPAYAEAGARGDREWLRRTAFRLLGRNVSLAALAGVALVAAGPFAIGMWTRGQVRPTRSLLGALAVYYVASTWTMSNGVLLIGIGRVRTKAVLQACVAGVHVFGAWFLLPVLGLIAIPVAGTAGYLIDISLSLPLALRHVENRCAPVVTHAGAVAARSF